MDNSQRIIEIKKRLQDAFQPATLEVHNDSHLHAGHAGAKSGKGHFTVVIAAQTLDGQSMLSQHRAIYQALGTLMQTDIHALSIQVQQTQGE